MKKLMLHSSTLIMLTLTLLTSNAQDKKLDVDINVGKQETWYQQPWLWLIGGAVFILLLVALLRKK
jgi:hypothetical protein